MNRQTTITLASPLDAAAQRPAHQGDRTSGETRDQAHDAFGGHPAQRRPGQPACVTGVSQPPLIWVSCRGRRAVFTAGIHCWDRRPRTSPARWPMRHSHTPMVIRWTHPAWRRVAGCDLVSSPDSGAWRARPTILDESPEHLIHVRARSWLRRPSRASRGRRGRHYFPGKGPLPWDHDQLPAGLADSERIGSVLFEDAQDIGHRRAGFWLG